MISKVTEENYQEPRPRSPDRLLTGVLTAIFFGILVYPVWGEEYADLAMEVSLEQPACDQYNLHIRIQNNGMASVEMFYPTVPWVDPHHMILEAVTLHGKPLKRYLDFSHYRDAPISIQPGEGIEGSFSLNKQFFDLSQKVQEEGVNIFWAYYHRLLSGKEFPPHGGWFLLPKTSCSQKEKVPPSNS